MSIIEPTTQSDLLPTKRCGTISTPVPEALRPADLRCEHLRQPLAIDAPSPRLSWSLSGAGRGRRQTAYRILVASTREMLDQRLGDLWDSGKVDADDTLAIPYQGCSMSSAQHCWWAVCIWDEQDQSCWSAPAEWEMGLLEPKAWVADWVSGPMASPEGIDAPGSDFSMDKSFPMTTAIESAPLFYLRKTFDIDRPVAKARLYTTARGVYRAMVNNHDADDRVFAPGWTDYHKRIEYQAYDVTHSLKPGANTLCAILGEGWYAGYVGPMSRRRAGHYGMRPSLLAQLIIEFDDGERMLIKTDDSWRVNAGPVSYSDFLMGELCDARRNLTGWTEPAYDDAKWYEPVVDSPASAQLVAEKAQPIRVVEELSPISVRQTGEGCYIFDLGENMVGRVRLRTRGLKGQRITLRHGEALHDDGTVYTENLRSAKSEDIYILSGAGEETYEPLFTYHGFRYVEVSGLTHAPETDTLIGRVIMTQTPRTGAFSCSDPLINQLQSNIIRSQKSNFISIPTDCPQRDERLGWLGDAQVFARTAAFNMDVSAFFSKWMVDVTDAQLDDGQFPDTAPCIIFGIGGAPGWAEAGVIVPWTMYSMYGDTAIVERNWDAMTKWMAFLQRANPGHVRTRCLNLNFGDWLAPDPTTSKSLIATAFYARSARLMAQMAKAIGKLEEARSYGLLFQGIRTAFVREFVDRQGRVAGNTQTSYLLALGFDLLPDDMREAAGKHLVADINARGGRLSCGFLSINLLLPVLCDLGHTDVAFQLLRSEEYPSWGYCIKHGATSIWERWDSWTPEGGFQELMNSFNHYAFGSVGEWLYRYLAGIDTRTDAPGFKEISIHPHIGGGLTNAKAIYTSCRGDIKSAWRLIGQKFELDIDIPPNTSAVVTLPPFEDGSLTEGESDIHSCSEIEILQEDEGGIIIRVASGAYDFAMTLSREEAEEGCDT
jgi:alpha-L-rhamnosidase